MEESNIVRQLKAMIWKNYLLKKRDRSFLWEFLLPIVFIFYMKYVFRNECDDGFCTPDEIDIEVKIQAIRNPIIIVLIVPSLFSVAQRFIL